MKIIDIARASFLIFVLCSTALGFAQDTSAHENSGYPQAGSIAAAKPASAKKTPRVRKSTET